MIDEASDILDKAVEQARLPEPSRKQLVAEWTAKVNGAWKGAQDSVYTRIFSHTCL